MIDLNDAEKQVLDYASRALQDDQSRTPERIRQLVEAASLLAGVSKPGLAVNVEALIAELSHAAAVWTEQPVTVLTDGKVLPWWIERKPAIEPMRFWRRYRRYLEQEKNIRDKHLDALDEQTDKILDRIQNPAKSGAWDVRGMVVGSVQSGKTANYVGVIAKALDAGYKLIVILAGIHNNLRAQTQGRIDEGIVGFDSQRRLDPNRADYRVGVGRLLTSDLGVPPAITPLTTSAEKGDFTAGAQKATMSLAGGPIILVVKKNKTPLTHILTWTGVAATQLGHQGIGSRIPNVPLLLIDDEADNASINTKDKPGMDDDEINITTINKLIRSLLHRFEQSSYIGYTATPFANIFINPEAESEEAGKDLFPRDFIVNVRPGPRYVGPAKVFGYTADLDTGIDGQRPLPMVRTIVDHEDFLPVKHKQDHSPGGLPQSLKNAILAFLLACAARRCRGQRKAHNSMLIHVTRLVSVQERVKELVQEEFSNLRRAVLYDSEHPVWQALRTLWQTDFEPHTAEVVRFTEDDRLTSLDWDTVRTEIPVAADKIIVREIHGKSKEALDYSGSSDGISVIAVGGNKLSRGLTLEGLTVSYYLRSTKMYDTLMQMGRWFGYREGYLDLCRVYTTTELKNWFSYIAFAEEELKREFDQMADARMTPADYGLRVRHHPDGMMITALNKMAHGQTREVTFAGQLVQTAFFARDAERQTKNCEIVKNWLETLDGFHTLNEQRHLRWTATRDQVALFLEQILEPGFLHKSCSRFGPELRAFVEAQQQNGGLQEWAVIVPNGSRKSISFGQGKNVKTIYREDVEPSAPEYALSKANVQEPKHELLDLEDIVMTEQLAAEVLSKMQVKHDGVEVPLITPGAEAEAVTSCIGRPISAAVQTLGTLRNKRTIGAMRDEIRQLRPASRGLLLIYALDPAEVAGLENVEFIPAFAFSFPATHKAKRVKYLVNKVWLETQLSRFDLEDTLNEED